MSNPALDIINKKIEVARAANSIEQPQVTMQPQTQSPTTSVVVTRVENKPALPQPSIPDNSAQLVDEDEFLPPLPEELTQPEVVKEDLLPENVVTPSSVDEDNVDDLLNAPEDEKAQVALAKKENFARLRKFAKTKAEKAALYEQELEEAKTRLTKFETGEVLPEVFKDKQSRIDQLEVYEQIHNLKSSPAYKHRISEPLDNLSDELADLAEDYNVDPTVIHQALNIQNRAERNRLISKHFPDALGADEVKNLIGRIEHIYSEADEFEKTPSVALERLNNEHRQVLERQDHQRKSAIATSARGAWSDAIGELRADGSAASLLIAHGDPEYVKNHVTPMFQKAAQEYGKITKVLAENGLKELPPELAKSLARATILSYDSALSTTLSKGALDELEIMRTATSRINPLINPPIGQHVPRSAPVSTVTAPKTAKERGREVMQSVLNKK